MGDSLASLGLLFITQFVLTLYGAGLRRPFGSLETVHEVPEWLRTRWMLVFTVDILFVAFLAVMWWRLFQRMELWTFLIAFFVFAALGTSLANRVGVIKSSILSFAGAALASYVIFIRGV